MIFLKFTKLPIETLIKDLEILKQNAAGLAGYGFFGKDLNIGVRNIVYSNRIYFYTETPINNRQAEKLDSIAEEKKVFITIRSHVYVTEKIRLEKPIGFISHDLRDKELIAKQLAINLNSRLCHVWYDEFSLRIGDSLRASIEKGLRKQENVLSYLPKII